MGLAALAGFRALAWMGHCEGACIGSGFTTVTLGRGVTLLLTNWCDGIDETKYDEDVKSIGGALGGNFGGIFKASGHHDGVYTTLMVHDVTATREQ